MGASALRKLLIFIGGNLVVWGVVRAIDNRIDGKDFLGRKMEPKKVTTTDWRGNIILGTDDYIVE